MTNIQTQTETFSDVDLWIPEPAAPKVTPVMVTTAFKAIKGTHRYAALSCLARNFGKPVSRAKLIAAVYGADADEKAMIGALGMCLEGGRKSIVKLGLPFRIVKENATIALVSVS